MEMQDFKNSLSGAAPPESLSVQLKALWFEAKGGWDTAHELVQDENDANSAWVHGYLHRKEGDVGNAGYWYQRAGQPAATGSLEAEWEALAQSLLDQL